MILEEQVVSIFAAGNGYFDQVDVAHVGEAEKKLLDFAHKTRQPLLDKLGKGEWSDEIKEELKALCAEFNKQ